MKKVLKQHQLDIRIQGGKVHNAKVERIRALLTAAKAKVKMPKGIKE